MQYLGKYTFGRIKVGVYFDRGANAVASTMSDGASTVAQAFKRAVVKPTRMKKGLNVAQLLSIASAHGATVELRTAPATQELVESFVPSKRDSTPWLDNALKKVEQELQREKAEYEKWRGVRDLEEAHDNLARRREQIDDLNQKLIANAKEPHFVYAPGKWLPSEWQRTDRVRLNELKDQAKEKASSLRARIDFVRRTRIKELEEKRRDLARELEEERKAVHANKDELEALADESLALGVSFFLTSRPFLAQGRKGAAVRASIRDVHERSKAVSKELRTQLGLAVEDVGEDLLSHIFVPSISSLRASRSGRLLASSVSRALSLVPRDDLENELVKSLGALLDQKSSSATTFDVSRFPSAGEKHRLAYVGLALSGDLAQTRAPIFYDLDEQGPRHTAVVGGSGSGKSVCARLIVEGAALHGVPVLVFDPTRSWTGLAAPGTNEQLLKRYDHFLMKREWARAFSVRIMNPRLLTEDELLGLTAGAGITVLTSQDMTEEEEVAAVAELLRSLYALMNSWPETSRLRLLIALEEAHRYLRHKDLQPILELFARTARSRGVGLLVVSQVAVDLPPAIRNNCATKLQLFTNYAQDLTRAGQVFGSDVQKIVPTLGRGQGALHYPEYGTALVAFRPPLHSPTGLPEHAVQLQLAHQDLREILAALMSRQDAAGSPGATSSTEAKVAPPTLPSSRPPTTWRDMAARAASGAKSAAEVRLAITAAGLQPPSLRTLQRLLRDFHRKHPIHS